jgi:uncharacterized protein
MIKRFFSILAILLILSPAGCDHKAASGLPVTSVQIGPENFNLEIATSFHDQEVGLMHRDHLDPDHGMIFPFARADVQNFWNHDVHFPLDMIFLGPDQKIVSLKHMDAYSDKSCSSDEPAQYVIELNAGTVDRLKLKTGDSVALPKDVLNPGIQTVSQ